METASKPRPGPEPAASAPATTAAEQFAARSTHPLQRVQHVLHSHPSISPLLVLVVSLLVFSMLNPRFASAELALAGAPAGRP